jgi:uncharacterized repeat protein (TIGR02543 family)
MHVTYYSAHSSSGSVPVDEVEYAEGDSIVVLGNTGTLVREGFVFVRWNTLDNGFGTSYNVGAKFACPATDVDLYAQWRSTTVTVDNKKHKKTFIRNWAHANKRAYSGRS